MTKKNLPNRNITLLILVAALGYFVDIYDLLLFLIIKNKSLESLGVMPDAITDTGLWLMNWQMAGLLTGGILWGIIGDKKGRLSVLFGSIIMYSLANIANGFIQDINTYAVLRFIAGVGLAGALGAGITLISESMSKEKRGYGTMIVATIGLMGAVAAYYVGDKFDWRVAFFVGGAMGMLLLILRIGVFESGMFAKLKNNTVEKGNFMMLFNNRLRFKKYINSILIAVPVWFVVGILVGIAPEFAKELGINEPINTGRGIMFTYIGISLGDFLSGTLSQLFRTRKKIVFIFITLTYAGILFFLFSNGLSATAFYMLCVYFGVATGYWVVFVTMASEQFGTNLRATVTTTAPNFVRGSLIIVTFLFTSLRYHVGIINSALIVGSVTVIIAYLALYQLDETFGKDLDYIEPSGRTGI
ncbi:MFS transporter [Daejeonella oryzae]|uniref:MFS transporter n=1 Tax=Daejeonella oryzae TaxID=1122943 RepID=UPI0004049FD3|nr:MFS transporter [Daejeonella oryzae]